jgi:thiamine transport system substrate-binding protein
MNNQRTVFCALILLAGLLSACARAGTPAPTSLAPTLPSGEPVTLTVLTHDSFAVSESVVNEFQQANNIKLSFVKGGDAGAALNRVVLSKGSPLADVFYGVDSTFLSRALEADIFEPFDTPMLGEIADEFKLDDQNRALPVDYGDVCINYDKAYFAENNLAVPASLDDLLKPEYRGLLAVENPATSSPGLAFLMATIARYGADGYLGYWQQLRDNEVVVVNDWETAYYSNFSGSSGRGPQPMVVSYGSSPAAEMVFAEKPLAEAPTASIVAPGTCYRQIEFVGILKGTQNRDAAGKFVEFMLSKAFQEDMPLQMFVYPVNRGAALPDAFHQWAQAAQQPAQLPPADISANRQQWIQAWTETVLR